MCGGSEGPYLQEVSLVTEGPTIVCPGGLHTLLEYHTLPLPLLYHAQGFSDQSTQSYDRLFYTTTSMLVDMSCNY